MQCPKRPKESVVCPGAAVRGSCEPPDMVLELELGSSTRAVSALKPPQHRCSPIGDLMHSY